VSELRARRIGTSMSPISTITTNTARSNRSTPRLSDLPRGRTNLASRIIGEFDLSFTAASRTREVVRRSGGG
jgi:hypothetical protein